MTVKHLALRLSSERAALYKSRLAADRITMQQHLQRHVDSYLAGTSATAEIVAAEFTAQGIEIEGDPSAR